MVDNTSFLPPEIISDILSFLPTRSTTSIQTLLACSSSSHSLRSIALQSSLWRAHVLDRWAKGTRCLLQDDAYLFYRHRAMIDLRIETEIETMVDSATARIPAIERIRAEDDQVLDLLERLQKIDRTNRPEIYLCEAYWASQAHRAILRDEALRTWSRIAENPDDNHEEAFERGVWSFSAFRGKDYRDVSVIERCSARGSHGWGGTDPFLPEPHEQYLPRYEMDRNPRLVSTLLSTPEGQTQTSLKFIATSVMEHMQFLGFKPSLPHTFHNLNNHFLSNVWDALDSPSNSGTLPMSLVSVFCSFVRRLPEYYNVRACPIGFPGVLLAGIAHKDKEDWIIVNVFKFNILSANDTTRMLRDMRLEHDEAFMKHATPQEMCYRVARNILTSVRRGDDDGITDVNAITPSFYAVALALFHFSVPEPQSLYANWAVQLVQAEFPYDVAYLEKNTIGTYSTPERVTEVVALIEAIRDEDKAEPDVKETGDAIKWRIGQVFRHRLFGYVAVIRGFDPTCAADEQWIISMGVDTLPHGRHQPFYHVITEDGSSRYVAQENVADEQHRSLSEAHFKKLEQAVTTGRYFRKRIKPESGPGKAFFIKSKETEAMYPETRFVELERKALLDEKKDEATELD